VLAAAVLAPAHHQVRTLADVASMPGRAGLGSGGDVAMAFGMYAAMFGAAIETALACGYMVAQYRHWSWGMDVRPRRARGFFAVVIATLAVATVVIVAGANVIALTDDTLVVSTVVLPLTYWPVFVLARDRRKLGELVAGRIARPLATICLLLVAVVALLALPALALGA